MTCGFQVSVLFARERSNYRFLPGVDLYPASRDARTFNGGTPVIAHPPCRAWGRLRQFAKPRPDEAALAVFAIDQVRRYGGVLEHPAHSTLWAHSGLPLPGNRDAFGGFTFPIYQSDFGHRAPKPTWLYIVGCEPSLIPDLPFELALPEGRIELMGKSEREATPAPLCQWLFDLALTCRGLQ
ncbi:hypothetical protein [Vogesella indigofera]|uniref:hypothetical protein n=1 Tax=Vogesella indigofera TaxID=45465 RepID=UPI00234E6EA3|nr:hypothetical protein [Vogesella indigofera]MDC7712203.1 hypothetical protein [Vogesella indigofera]